MRALQRNGVLNTIAGIRCPHCNGGLSVQSGSKVNIFQGKCASVAVLDVNTSCHALVGEILDGHIGALECADTINHIGQGACFNSQALAALCNVHHVVQLGCGTVLDFYGAIIGYHNALIAVVISINRIAGKVTTNEACLSIALHIDDNTVAHCSICKELNVLQNNRIGCTSVTCNRHLADVGVACTVNGDCLADRYILLDIGQQSDDIAGLGCCKSISQRSAALLADHGDIGRCRINICACSLDSNLARTTRPIISLIRNTVLQEITFTLHCNVTVNCCFTRFRIDRNRYSTGINHINLGIFNQNCLGVADISHHETRLTGIFYTLNCDFIALTCTTEINAIRNILAIFNCQTFAALRKTNKIV